MADPPATTSPGTGPITDRYDLASNPRHLIGKVVSGKYEVLDTLGQGGMGVVYKVRHLVLQNRNLFALKILKPNFSADELFRRRFMREVELVMDLTHENIVQIREFGLTEDNMLFFTMDFFDGEPLSHVIKKGGPMKPARALGIVRQVLLALDAAHGDGVVHRDLKPDNILVRRTPEGDQVRVLDFGIAKVIEGEETSTTLTQGGVIGTPAYMSPEQASGEAIDGRSDLYSLGIVLYEMLAGRAPFRGKTARSILVAQMTKEPPPFAEIREGLSLPGPLEAFVFKLLDKEPGRRPASAKVCLRIIEGAPPAASGPPASAAKARPSKRRWIGLAATVLVVAAGALGWLLSRGGSWAAARSGADPVSPVAVGDRLAPESPPTGATEEEEELRVRCYVCSSDTYLQGAIPYDICPHCHTKMLVVEESDG